MAQAEQLRNEGQVSCTWNMKAYVELNTWYDFRKEEDVGGTITVRSNFVQNPWQNEEIRVTERKLPRRRRRYQVSYAILHQARTRL
jgi:hypothetical protein